MFVFNLNFFGIQPILRYLHQGTAKRNILRKGKPVKARKEGAAGHMIEEIAEPFVEVVLDKDDPNYDSEAEDDGTILSSFSRDKIDLGQ